MSLELYNRASSYAGIDTFRPADHLLGIVQHAVASLSNIKAVLPGKGEVVILPDRGMYYTNVKDMAEFCSAPLAQFNTIGFDAAELKYFSNGKSINGLLWNAAFHASKGRILEGCSICDFVKLRHWPNLTRLPVTSNTARICALLTRQRTVIVSASHVLGIDSEEVCQIYSAAFCAGIADVINLSPEMANLKTVADTPRPDKKQKHGLLRSLFIKLSRL